jgi:hypothetical protein
MNTTLAKAAEMVNHSSQRNWDRALRASELEFPDFNHLRMRDDGAEHKMLPSAKRLISHRLRLPAEYLERCPQNLQAENLNYWLEKLGDAPPFCRFNDHGVRAFFTTRYKPINNHEIMARVLETFPAHTEVEFRISNEMMLLNVPDHTMAFKISHEQILPGSHFANSEVGLVAYSCSVFYLRLICTNGLISADTLAVKTPHIKRNALNDFNGTMEEVRRMAGYQEGRMRLSVESQVDDPKASIGSFGKRFGLTNEEIQMAQAAWDEDPGYTLWNVIQAFTWTAKNQALPAETAYKFQRMGGQVLALVK